MLTFYNEQHARHRGRHEIFRGELDLRYDIEKLSR